MKYFILFIFLFTNLLQADFNKDGFFIKKGVDLKRKKPDNYRSEKSYQQLSREHYDRLEGIFKAAEKDNLKKLKKILSQDKDLLTQAHLYGRNLLHIAAVYGSYDVAKYLLASGLNVDSKDGIKRRAIHYAASQKDPRVLKLLIQKGAKINVIDDEKKTPLHYASELGNLKNMEVLIKKGAQINAGNSQEETALFFATSNGEKDATLLLLKKGANINAKNYFDRTALMELVADEYSNLTDRKKADIAEILLSHGADFSRIKDYKGRTAHDLSVEFDQTRIEKLFIKRSKLIKRSQDKSIGKFNPKISIGPKTKARR